MPVHFTASAPPGWRPITEGEPAMDGDKYSNGNMTWVVGTTATHLKAGEPWPKHLMLYNPVRIKEPR